MGLTAHQARIKAELTMVGVTAYGQQKMSSRYLPNVIHEDEHIKGCIYGRSAHGLTMLLATDKRIVFVDRKPLYTSTDELTYDIVSGVRLDSQMFFTAVELHTRLGNYLLRYVNPTCARIFVEYIEKKVEHLNSLSQESIVPPKPSGQVKISAAAKKFLQEHELGVISTANRTGDIHGAVVNYLFDENDFFFILTKSETSKAHNMLGNHKVALTIYDANDLKTIQLQGIADIETNLDQKFRVFREITKPRNYNGDVLIPPVTQLAEGGFITFRITPTEFHFRSFKPDETTLEKA